MPSFLRSATLLLFAAAGFDAAAAPCTTTTVAPAAALSAGTVGVAYNREFTASSLAGGPFTFAVTSGLPAGSGLGFTATGPGSANLGGTPVLAGIYRIHVAATDASGCIGGRSYTLAIAQGTQSISFATTAPANATIGGAPYAVAAVASSGLPVTLGIAAASSAVCSLAGGNVTFQTTGTCTINANQAGDANYAAASQVQQSFTVSKADQSISFTSTAPANAQIGGAAYVVSATASSGLPVSLSIDAAASSVCSIAGASVSFQSAGTCVINANQVGNASFNAALQVQQSFAVGAANQSISFTSTAPTNAVFNGASYTVAATATSGLPVSFSIDASASSVCAIAGSSVSFQGVGTCLINANQAGNANYNAAPQVQQSFAVGAANQIISFSSTAPTNAVFNGASYTVTATATSGLPVSFSIDASASSVCAIAGSSVSFQGVGTCLINANQAGNANYNAAPQVQQSFAVAKADQSISFTSTAPTNAVFNGASYTVAATASSGLPVSFSIDASASSVCAIAGSSVSFQGVGTCVINANQAGNANYNAAPQVQQSFAVAKADQSIGFSSTAPTNAVFNGTSYTVTATATSGLPVSFSIDASASSVCAIAGSSVSFQGVGTCVINANQAGNANYNAAPQVQQSFAVAKADQSISFSSIAPVNAVFNGASYTVAATASSGLPVSFSIDASASSVCAIAGSSVSFQGVGTCLINANQAGNANYNAAPQVQQSFAVAKADQSISFSSTAPVNAVFNGASYTVTATASSGLPVSFSIDASASSVCTLTGSDVSFQGAGTCVINADQAGNANYNAATQAQQSFAVAKADQSISFTSTAPVAATAGGATYTVTATASSGLPVSFAIDAAAASICTLSGSDVTFIDAGTCVINADQAGDTNWNAAPQVQQSFAVAASACLNLAVGQVAKASMPAGASICINNNTAAATEYTYLPINSSASSNVDVSLLGNNIQAVTGPPTPLPPEQAGTLELAPLRDGAAAALMPAESHPADNASPFPAGRAYSKADLVPAGGSRAALVVGQLINLNVAQGGCSAATDIRTGRVEAITTPVIAGQQVLYAVQEVVELPPPATPGTWVPAVTGGFNTQEFQNIIDAFVQLPPGATPLPSFSTTLTLLKTGALSTFTNTYGALTDLDDNNGVIVFYTRKMNELSPPASSAFAPAAFLPRDLFSAASCPGSNEGEVLYMAVPDPTGSVNSNVRTQSTVYTASASSLVHHFSHLMSATRRLYFNGAAPLQETWLEEALAWKALNLIFFNTSVGLGPRGNIQLSTLTTGPNASARVQAFNTFENQMFGHSRTYFHQLTSNSGRRAGPLRQQAYSVQTVPNVHENTASNYVTTYVFLQYAFDRLNTGDAALLSALVNSSEVGRTNLQTALGGVDLDEWARDFLVAAYADDAVAGMGSDFLLPSWNFRSVFGGLGGFPLVTNPLNNGTSLNLPLGTGGSTRYVRFGIAAGTTATLDLTSGGGTPPATVTTAIVRTK